MVVVDSIELHGDVRLAAPETTGAADSENDFEDDRRER
jgi:hypothetical protein